MMNSGLDAPRGREEDILSLGAPHVPTVWQAESRAQALTGGVDRREHFRPVCAGESLYGLCQCRVALAVLYEWMLLLSTWQRGKGVLLLCEEGADASGAKLWSQQASLRPQVGSMGSASSCGCCVDRFQRRAFGD
jgi:hypothetical protein